MNKNFFITLGMVVMILQGCYVLHPGISYPYRVVGGGEQGNPSVSQNSAQNEEDLACRSEYDRVMTEIDGKHHRFLRELGSYLKDGGNQKKADQSMTAEAEKYSAARESAMVTREKCINGIIDGKTQSYRYRSQRQDRNSNYGQQYAPDYYSNGYLPPGYLPFFPVYDYTWRWRGDNYWYCLDWPQYCGGRWGGRHRWRWRRNHRW